jgi:hypothetical protein
MLKKNFFAQFHLSRVQNITEIIFLFCMNFYVENPLKTVKVNFQIE